MKQLLMPSVILILGIGFITYGIFTNKVPKRNDSPKVIKSVIDDRGLTSVEYVKGKDTLALDYLTPIEYIKEFNCPDCGDTNCIYQQINEEVKGEGTDSEIMEAIKTVCKERGIKDSATVELLKANYYL